jgi:two-component system cell cycle response regulator DivK
VVQKIMVVEDNELNLKLFCDLLRAHAYVTEPVRDGREAVETARVFAPDLIVMDIQMPNVDGYEAARRIRAEPWGYGAFLVALTGWGASNGRRRTHDAGFDLHLVKPVDPDALARMIAEVPIESPDPEKKRMKDE